MSATGFAGWAIEALVASALLIAAVLLVRVPVRRAFGPAVAYALWALPLLRLLLPPLPAAWHGTVAMPISSAGETLTVFVVDPAVVAPTAGSAWASVGTTVGLIWLAGAVAFLGWHLIGYRRFRHRVLTSAVAVERRGDITVVTTPAAPGPLAFGILDRYVAFPIDAAGRYDAAERELALAHELGHHARGDLIANWAALAMLALHWFNPLAWHAFHAFRADQELANDARVLAGRDPAERHAYACAIVKAAHGGAVSAACHLHTVRNLKGRLKMLTTARASRRQVVTGAASIVLLTGAGLGLTASGTSAAATINETVKASTGVDLQIPTPPAPPAPIASNVPPAPLASPTGKRPKRVVIVRNGKATTYDGAAADAYLAAHPMPVPPSPPGPGVLPPQAPDVPPVPAYEVFVRGPDGNLRKPTATEAPRIMIRQVRSVDRRSDGKTETLVVTEPPEVIAVTCPASGDSKQMVLRDVRDGKQRMMVCTSRIAAIETGARGSARANLKIARASIEAERNLTDDQRRQALAGIAQAERELDAQVD